MNIRLTESAQHVLNTRSSKIEDNILFIKYDTEGCGCVVSGVSKLLEIEAIDEKLELVETSPCTYKVAYEKQYEWAYDENLIIDFNSASNTFMLKSPNQILNPRMSFTPLKK
ncbi:uncharacterized protein YqkB [Evansella vedderi]|uniref:Uncharacterized protein YqkB n=1 Tax=Evansella vedderi TaxID=38282 RepID=A0ABT9ZT38_9BACI|nr:iron-sulfur cluster biosynthesis family protein [Evansella vedderi]MDQ0254402.1 uncharacterized protein YqkB [Evansella vedderi]